MIFCVLEAGAEEVVVEKSKGSRFKSSVRLDVAAGAGAGVAAGLGALILISRILAPVMPIALARRLDLGLGTMGFDAGTADEPKLLLLLSKEPK